MKAKRAHPPKAQTPPKDRIFLSQTIKFKLKRAKIPLKSNKNAESVQFLVSYSACFSGGTDGGFACGE